MTTASQNGQTIAQKGSPLSIEKRPDGVFILRMDIPGEPVNTLKASFAVVHFLKGALDVPWRSRNL